MKPPLLDKLERLHAERLIKRLRDSEYWGTGVMIEKSTLGEAADALASVPALVAALRLAVEALEKVTNKHQSYDENGSGQYGIGVTDGHRCAAGYASAALAKIEALMSTEEATL